MNKTLLQITSQQTQMISGLPPIKAVMGHQPTERISESPDAGVRSLVDALKTTRSCKVFTSREAQDPATRKEGFSPLLTGSYALFHLEGKHQDFEMLAASIYEEYSSSAAATLSALVIFRNYTVRVGAQAVFGIAVQSLYPLRPWAEQRSAIDVAVDTVAALIVKHSQTARSSTS